MTDTAADTTETKSLGEGGTGLPPEEVERITADLVAALKTVYEPEIPVEIYELGLIYRVDLDDDRMLRVGQAARRGFTRFLAQPGEPAQVAELVNRWISFDEGIVRHFRRSAIQGWSMQSSMVL